MGCVSCTGYATGKQLQLFRCDYFDTSCGVHKMLPGSQLSQKWRSRCSWWDLRIFFSCLFFFIFSFCLQWLKLKKWSIFPSKDPAERNLHYIIQIVIKCIICSNYTVHFWVCFEFLHFVFSDRTHDESQRINHGWWHCTDVKLFSSFSF